MPGRLLEDEELPEGFTFEKPLNFPDAAARSTAGGRKFYPMQKEDTFAPARLEKLAEQEHLQRIQVPENDMGLMMRLQPKLPEPRAVASRPSMAPRAVASESVGGGLGALRGIGDLAEMAKGAIGPQADAPSLARQIEDARLADAQRADSKNAKALELARLLEGASAKIRNTKADLSAYEGDGTSKAKDLMAQLGLAQGRRAEDESARRFGVTQEAAAADRLERGKDRDEDRAFREKSFGLQMEDRADARKAAAADRAERREERAALRQATMDAKKAESDARLRVGDFVLESPVPESSRGDLMKKQGEANQLLGAIDTARKQVDKSGIGFTGKDAGLLRQAVKDIHLKLKNTQGLGVLAGPDMEILEGMVGDPTRYMAFMKDKIGATDFRSALDALDGAAKRDVIAYHQGFNRGRPMEGSRYHTPATVSGEGSPKAPPGGVVRRRNKRTGEEQVWNPAKGDYEPVR